MSEACKIPLWSWAGPAKDTVLENMVVMVLEFVSGLNEWHAVIVMLITYEYSFISMYNSFLSADSVLVSSGLQ